MFFRNRIVRVIRTYYKPPRQETQLTSSPPIPQRDVTIGNGYPSTLDFLGQNLISFLSTKASMHESANSQFSHHAKACCITWQLAPSQHNRSTFFYANIHQSFFSLQFDLTVICCREKGVDADISYQSLSIEIKA